MAKLREANPHEDDEFMRNVLIRRDFIEKITMLVTIGFLVNSMATFMALKYLFEETDKHSYLVYVGIYAENVFVVSVILYIFNKYKF